jgi:hypothetical protein
VHCHRNVEAERQAYVAQLFRDTVGFSAAKIIRRILGLAHNIDFELIEDPKRRAVCEARSLRLARAMLVDAASFGSIGAVTKGAGGTRLAAGFRWVREGRWLPLLADCGLAAGSTRSRMTLKRHPREFGEGGSAPIG